MQLKQNIKHFNTKPNKKPNKDQNSTFSILSSGNGGHRPVDLTSFQLSYQGISNKFGYNYCSSGSTIKFLLHFIFKEYDQSITNYGRL